MPHVTLIANASSVATSAVLWLLLRQLPVPRLPKCCLGPKCASLSRAWGLLQFACVLHDKADRVELLPLGHHVRVSENVAARNPIFCVVLKDGEHWQVEAEWPDGTIEPSSPNSKLDTKL